MKRNLLVDFELQSSFLLIIREIYCYCFVLFVFFFKEISYNYELSGVKYTAKQMLVWLLICFHDEMSQLWRRCAGLKIGRFQEWVAMETCLVYFHPVLQITVRKFIQAPMRAEASVFVFECFLSKR